MQHLTYKIKYIQCGSNLYLLSSFRTTNHDDIILCRLSCWGMLPCVLSYTGFILGPTWLPGAAKESWLCYLISGLRWHSARDRSSEVCWKHRFRSSSFCSMDKMRCSNSRYELFQLALRSHMIICICWWSNTAGWLSPADLNLHYP